MSEFSPTANTEDVICHAADMLAIQSGAEAIVVPIYVRLDGLERLGLHDPIDPAIAAHHERIRSLPGWTAVVWTREQTDEFVDRHRR